MRKLIVTATMLALLLPLAALGVADAKPLPGDGPNLPKDTEPCGEQYKHTPPGEGCSLSRTAPCGRATCRSTSSPTAESGKSVS